MIHEPKIRAVAFDFDGTLVDTFEHVIRAFEFVLPQYGITATRDDIQAHMGLTLHECYEKLVSKEAAAAAKQKHHDAQQSEELFGLITSFDAMHETLQILKKRGIDLTIITNRTQPSLNSILKHVGLQNQFAIIISPELVERPKPYPDGLFAICQKLGISSRELLLVGDTGIDMQTAKSANLRAAVGITHGFGSREELEATGADYIIDSLPVLAEVIERLERGED